MAEQHTNGHRDTASGASLAPLLTEEAEIIAAIRRQGPLSRTDLAQLTGYSRPKITPLVGRLLALGLLEETGEGESQGGRRPRLLTITQRERYVAGIDIGATSIDVALADFSGRVIAHTAEEARVTDGPQHVLSRACALVFGLATTLQIAPTEVHAVGVGVPGPVQFTTGLLIAPPLMPTWDAYPIGDTIREHFPLARVVVDNDVNVMALGELRAGAARGVENLIFVKVGTGIGAGIVCHGAVYRGSDGCAGDIGHICADGNGPTCHCGNVGCLEAMAAGPSIAARAIAAAHDGNSQFLSARLGAHGTLSAVDVGAAAAGGDRAAIAIIQDSGRLIGGVLASLVNFFNPRLVLLGGGVSQIGYHLLAAVRQAVLQRSLPLSTKDLRIEYASLGLRAGTTGAVALALEHVFVIDDKIPIAAS